MARIIKFRGKDSLTGEWVYGHYTTAKSRDPETGEPTERHIIHSEDGMHEIDPETLGQFVGLKDKNGKDIYEGDMLETCVGDGFVIYESDASRFALCDCWKWTYQLPKYSTIFGNIYDKIEMLNKQ